MKKLFIATLFLLSSLLFASEKRYVNCKQLDLRASNTNFGRKIGSVVYGEELTVISESNNWCELKSVSGLQGWAQETNLSKRKITSSIFSINFFIYF